MFMAATTYNMRFCASHIYREGNTCADNFANFGLSLSSFDIFWFDVIPEFVRGEYIRNRLGMPNFRFTTFWKGFGLIPLFFLVLSFLFLWIELMLFTLKKKNNNNKPPSQILRFNQTHLIDLCFLPSIPISHIQSNSFFLTFGFRSRSTMFIFGFWVQERDEEYERFRWGRWFSRAPFN